MLQQLFAVPMFHQIKMSVFRKQWVFERWNQLIKSRALIELITCQQLVEHDSQCININPSSENSLFILRARVKCSFVTIQKGIHEINHFEVMSEQYVTRVKVGMYLSFLMSRLQFTAYPKHQVHLLIVIQLGVAYSVVKFSWVISYQLSFGVQHYCLNPLVIVWSRNIFFIASDGHYLICQFLGGLPNNCFANNRYPHEKDLVNMIFLINIFLLHHLLQYFLQHPTTPSMNTVQVIEQKNLI